ncbi:hypothetical protein V8D89_001184, partial [Ganoderma adspersum]
ELLVIGITWWYTYQSYRIRRGVELGKTISSLLLYNGNLYFLFLTSLCILDIIFSTASLPVNALNADTVVTTLYDPISSIIVCRFMLSLRQFDSTIASMPTLSLRASQIHEHMASKVLKFAAQPTDSLPSFIESFSHPIHVHSALDDMDPESNVGDAEGSDSEWHDMNVSIPTSKTPSPVPSLAPGQYSSPQQAA